MTTAADIVEEAKAADENNPGIVNLITNDPELERLVAVWANVQVPADPDPGEECPPDLPPAVRLRWVWSRLEPDPIPAWIATAGLPDAPHVRRAITMAIDNRVVFPDGTLSSWALVYVQQQARRTLGIRPPEPQQASQPASVASAAPPPEPPQAAAPYEYERDGMIRPGRRLRGAGGDV